MKAYYKITSGGISDLINQLVTFSGVCYYKGIQPGLAQFTSRRYQPNTELFIRHDTSFIEKELFGNIQVHSAPDSYISLSEFAELDVNDLLTRKNNSVRVDGDEYYSVMPRLVKGLQENTPGKWIAARKEGYLFTQKLIRNGEIYKRFLQNSKASMGKMQSQTIVTAHCRLGDVAFARREDFRKTDLYPFFKSDFFLNTNLSKDQFFSIMQQSSPSAVWKRILESPKISSFVAKLNMLKAEPNGHNIHSIFCTDGYTHISDRFERINKPSIHVDDIEDIFNQIYLADVKKSYDECLIGENFSLLISTIDIALQADVMILGNNSYFPIGLRRILGIKDPRIIALENEIEQKDYR